MDQITTYATLQAAVAGTLHRPDDTAITDNVPLWIQMCEADLYDKLLLKDSEQEDTLTGTVDVNYIAIPDGYISPIALWIVVDSERDKLPSVLPEKLPFYSDSGQPEYWAIDGANIRFDRPCDDAYSFRFRYWKKSSLSDSNTSNYLLLRRPDVYLYGTLWQASLFTEDDNAAQKWSAHYERAISALKAADNRARAVPLRTDILIPLTAAKRRSTHAS